MLYWLVFVGIYSVMWTNPPETCKIRLLTRSHQPFANLTSAMNAASSLLRPTFLVPRQAWTKLRRSRRLCGKQSGCSNRTSKQPKPLLPCVTLGTPPPNGSTERLMLPSSRSIPKKWWQRMRWRRLCRRSLRKQTSATISTPSREWSWQKSSPYVLLGRLRLLNGVLTRYSGFYAEKMAHGGSLHAPPLHSGNVTSSSEQTNPQNKSRRKWRGSDFGKVSRINTHILIHTFFGRRVSYKSAGSQWQSSKFSQARNLRRYIGTTRRFQIMALTRTPSSPLFVSFGTHRSQLSGTSTKFKDVFCPWSPSSGSATFGTWNARALLHSTPARCKRKCSFLANFLKVSLQSSCPVWALQEVHGSEPQFFQLNHWVRTKFYIFSSFLDVGVGGVVTLFPRTQSSSIDQFSSESIIPGRVLRVAHYQRQLTFVHWNVHNFNLGVPGLSMVLSRLEADLQMAAADPLKFTVILAGDLNLMAPGDMPTRLARPALAQPLTAIARSSNPWGRIFDRMVEVRTCLDTHYDARSDSMSRIDRIFVSFQPWTIVQVRSVCHVWEDPRQLFEQGISDHAPVSTTFSIRCPIPRHRQPISKSVATSQRFGTLCSQLVKVADLGCLSAPVRLRQHKRIIREAGLIARDEASVSLSADPENLVSLYATISRAVWYDDRRVYNLLISRYDLACKHLTMVDGVVTLLVPSLFNDEYNARKVAAGHSARPPRCDGELE